MNTFYLVRLRRQHKIYFSTQEEVSTHCEKKIFIWGTKGKRIILCHGSVFHFIRKRSNNTHGNTNQTHHRLATMET